VMYAGRLRHTREMDWLSQACMGKLDSYFKLKSNSNKIL
jgi:hypothetical protein